MPAQPVAKKRERKSKAAQLSEKIGPGGLDHDQYAPGQDDRN
jgi:hypothetical protein